MKYLLSIILLILANSLIYSQRFSAGLSAGFNISELEKNSIDGNIGITAGIRGIVNLKSNWQLSTALLYSQQGDYFDDILIVAPLETHFLQYLEIPIQFHHLFLKNEEKDFYQCQLNYGITYARLIDANVVTIDGLALEVYDTQNPNRLLYNLGVTGFFNPNFGIDFRGTMTSGGTFTLTFKGLYLL